MTFPASANTEGVAEPQVEQDLDGSARVHAADDRGEGILPAGRRFDLSREIALDAASRREPGVAVLEHPEGLRRGHLGLRGFRLNRCGVGRLRDQESRVLPRTPPRPGSGSSSVSSFVLARIVQEDSPGRAGYARRVDPASIRAFLRRAFLREEAVGLYFTASLAACLDPGRGVRDSGATGVPDDATPGSFDAVVGQFFYGLRSPRATAVMRAATFLGDSRFLDRRRSLRHHRAAPLAQHSVSALLFAGSVVGGFGRPGHPQAGLRARASRPVAGPRPGDHVQLPERARRDVDGASAASPQ